MPYAQLDVGAAGQRTEPGFIGIGTAAVGTNNTNLAATTLTSSTADSFSVAISNLDATNAVIGGIDWRDRGDSTSAQSLVQVGEDFIKNNAGVIRVTLGGLDAGQYQVTSYHRDSDNGQSDQIQVFLTDANGTAVLQSSTGNAGPAGGTGVGVNNLTTANVQSTAATFAFTSNGTSDVVIVFDGRISSDDETPFNG